MYVQHSTITFVASVARQKVKYRPVVAESKDTIQQLKIRNEKSVTLKKILCFCETFLSKTLIRNTFQKRSL